MRKLNLVLIALFAITIASPAFATFGSDCNGNNNCNTDRSVTDDHSINNRATGGDASARAGASSRSGAAAGVFGSGNSSSRSGVMNSGNNRNRNTNVGIQGQLGILDSDVDVTNRLSNDTDVSNRQGQEQGQHQGQVGIVKDGDVQVVDDSEAVVEGDDIVYEAPEIPVNSAAPVFAGACSQGVSVQTHSFGGSAGTTNPVCDYVAVAGGFTAAGERTEAVRVLGKAEGAADWRYRIYQVRSILTLGLL